MMSDTMIHGEHPTNSGIRCAAILTLFVSPDKEDSNSPAMDLPPEILLEIAKMAIEESLDNESTKEAPPPLPLVLSQVCHHWRAVVCSDPSLWTRLALSPKSTTTFNVRRYLEKSRTSSIKLDIILPYKVPPRKFIEEMANIILPQYFDRFREVYVYHKQCGFGKGCPYFQLLGLGAFD
ncbi:hypothetical protein NP233_g2291 [Leucocoprinus birnbaumii]|uniref:F-box domain-containing protein n=1 Tax=Leucocoprinus birnbaumii TaxID=56174 RepID=A0AAD5VZ54_9AGAR|nr:hypothetical protein NP233_g2291 [Leucocoprinus birnbaumii]